MKHSYILLTITSALSIFAANTHADNYSEMLAFNDGSTASLSFSFDLSTGYYANINGTVLGSTDQSANGIITEELGSYMHFADYTPETPASQNVLESPGTSLALFNSNNATSWINSPAVFENFLIQNHQLQVDVADYGAAAATLYYPDLGYPVATLNSLTSYVLIDTTLNPTLTTTNFSSSVPLPSSFILFASAVCIFAASSVKKPNHRTCVS